MKPTLFVPIHRGAISLVFGLRKRFAILLMAAIATSMGASVAFSQGPYYQVNPPGSGLAGATYNELAYVNSLLQPSTVSIFNPLPPGTTAANATQINLALATAVQSVIAGTVPAQYSGITLGSLATQMVANQSFIAAQTAAQNAPTGDTQAQVTALQSAALSAAISSVEGQIATSIISNSSSSAVALTNLNSVVTSLAATYPSGVTTTTYPTTFPSGVTTTLTVSTVMAPIFTSAAANAGTAAQLSQIALTATQAVSTNVQPMIAPGAVGQQGLAADQAVGAIVQQALATLAAVTPSPTFTAAQIQTAITNVISSQFSSTVINSSPTSLAAIATGMTTSNVLATVPLGTVLNTALAALPAADKAATTLGNVSVGAIAVGALISDPGNSSGIMSGLAANSNTSAYTNMIVNGYLYSSGTPQAGVTVQPNETAQQIAMANYAYALKTNPNYADAIVAGATVQGIVSPATLITDALQAGGTATVQNVVAAAVSADLAKTSVGYYTNNIPSTAPTDNATPITNAAVASFYSALPTTAASSTTTQTVLSTSSLYVGESVTGAGIAGGTTISSITNTTTIVLSQAPSAAVTSGEVIAFGSVTSATLQSIAQGGVGAARIADAGPITFAVISDSPGYTAPSGANGTLTTANVSAVVNGAVTAAYTTKQTAVADAAVANIVYNAEKASYNTSATLTTPVTQAITTMQALDAESDLPTYVAAAAALAGYAGPSPGTAVGSPPQTPLQMIQSAAEMTPGYTPTAAATNAINAAYAIVNQIRPSSGGSSGSYGVNTTTAFPNTMSAFSSNASAPDSVQAVLYAASLADPNDSSAFLAAAIAKTPVASSTLLADAINVSQVVTNANELGNPVTGLTLVSSVASHLATNFSNQAVSDISNFVGFKATQNPNYVKDIATAAVTVDPYQSNYVARAVAYNSPTTAYQAISSIFNYSQITTIPANPGKYAGSGGYIDPVSAAAAISAGYTTGIVESASSPTMTSTTVGTALNNGIAASVSSALSVLGTPLRGALINQSTGTSTTAFTNTASVGAAGVITGFVSQVVEPTDTTTLGGTNTMLNPSGATSTSIINAVLTAAVKVAGASTYTLQMAQAAGQAYGYITGVIGGQSTDTAGVYTTTATQTTNDASIAKEIATAVTGATSGTLYTYAYNAAYYGATQGQTGVPGAGATGVSQNVVNGTSTQYYNQYGAQGAPVTNIFNL